MEIFGMSETTPDWSFVFRWLSMVTPSGQNIKCFLLKDKLDFKVI